MLPLKTSWFEKIFPKKKTELLLEGLLLSFLLLGIVFRFSWTNWSQGTNLHPDEYGLTNTLTQINLPDSIKDYFNTRVSPLSPYQKYDLDGNPTANGPDHGMRWGQWPIILLRGFAEASGNTGYDELRLMGRKLSALADSLSLLLVFLTVRRLYNRRIALFTVALSALAVMQIQQSHFMTVDNFATLFTSAAMYSAMRIATTPNLKRKPGRTGGQPSPDEAYAVNLHVGKWYLAFGMAFGMAVASRINLLPLGGIVLVAAFLGLLMTREPPEQTKFGADFVCSAVGLLPKRGQSELRQIMRGVLFYLLLFTVAAVLTFRVTQPMSFRDTGGDTTLFDFSLNPDWVNNMNLSMNESKGIGGGPPAEQWANRPIVFFPWMNMVVWGMGLPLGIAAWVGLVWAAWGVFRFGDEWRSHLLPLAWAGGFFLFMGTRWASSIRYYLPIYPFLILFAGWLLNRLLEKKRPFPYGKNRLHAYIQWSMPALVTSIVLLGTVTWAYAFVRAVYMQDHTRIRASRWIYENIPATREEGGDEASRPVIANESWDEGLPLSIDGKEPWPYYQFLTMEVRWYDNEKKRQMFLNSLDQADYILLPSQRAIWSTSRIPLTYPMTMEYYRALFDGRLGFELVAMFSAPFKAGPVYISDVGGSVAFHREPSLPLFNDRLFAAEEAFSVYDHPPVWIFKKRADFNLESARSVLDAVDLSRVVIQSPREAEKVGSQ